METFLNKPLQGMAPLPPNAFFWTRMSFFMGPICLSSHLLWWWMYTKSEVYPLLLHTKVQQKPPLLNKYPSLSQAKREKFPSLHTPYRCTQKCNQNHHLWEVSKVSPVKWPPLFRAKQEMLTWVWLRDWPYMTTYRSGPSEHRYPLCHNNVIICWPPYLVNTYSIA